MRVIVAYLAAPFFNPKEVIEIDEVVKSLSKISNLSIIQPSQFDIESRGGADQLIFKLDTKAIKFSDIVIALTNNYDEGTIWECGFAYATYQKPIFIYRKDPSVLNLMLRESSAAICPTINDLYTAVEAYVKGFNSIEDSGSIKIKED
jgi:nucleoside deoxyribosyltransferase